MLSFLWARSLRPSKRLAVDFPSGSAELRVDEYAGLGLVELSSLGRGGGMRDDELFLLGGRLRGDRGDGGLHLRLFGRSLREVGLERERQTLPF